MPRNRKVARTLALLAVPVLLGTAGCSTGPLGSDDPNTLRVVDYYNNEPSNTSIQHALDKCANETGVDLVRNTIPGEALVQKVLQMASSDTLPDLLMLDNPDMAQFASIGGLVPLDKFDVDTQGISENVLDAGSYQGEVYGLAPTVNTISLFYNKDILRKQGIEPPDTWAELKRTAKQLTTKDRYGFAFSGAASYEGTWQFLPFMWSNGGDETNIDSKEVTEALQLLTDMVKAGSVSQSVVNWGQGEVIDRFIGQKAAMVVNGPWNLPRLKAEATFDFGVVPIPVPDPGDTSVAPLGGEVWTVPKTENPDKQAMAAEMIECLNTDENQMAMAKDRLTIPSKPDVAAEYAKQSEAAETFVNQVGGARARTAKLGEDWPATAQAIYTAVQTALTGQASPEVALDRAARTIK
ncbi:sugar ABC transporter substrate-binding protein [Arthrobacter castelli]|uniref:sugar ABC transporter substrate-binding protein n=1 Tax=Arthrobacter castelli TaxID=271431 RepID=UPI00047C45FD|nr:sugar ABC transporter substrate-binding protein [Arthrobacter castelli]